jgi:preprotein translocase subunit SecF
VQTTTAKGAGDKAAAAPPPRFFKLVPNDLKIDYLRLRWWTLGISWVVIGLGIAAYLVRGLSFGIDFTGGTLIQVQVQEAADIGAMRATLDAANLGSFTLQALGGSGGQEYLIVLGAVANPTGGKGEGLAQRVEVLLKKQYPSLTLRRVESVGPKVGEELKQVAFNSVIWALGAILIYIWVRFEWRYSVGAVVATLHDVLIVTAAFVLTQKEITLTVVAAILTIAGFSVNDTVVVFDRMRENSRRFRKTSMYDNINDSINQTLSRTVLTSGTVFIVVIVMFFAGGEILHDFAFAMLIGVVVGTYSSIFQAAPVMFMLHRWFPPKVK